MPGFFLNLGLTRHQSRINVNFGTQPGPSFTRPQRCVALHAPTFQPYPKQMAGIFRLRRLAIAFSTMREPRSAAMMIASYQCPA
jgi:hypothetical protein